MAARRSIRSINWAALAERVPEQERANYLVFKAKTDQYLKRLSDNPEHQPKIDWSFYKNKIAIQGLVDKFQKEYEALKVPYPEDKYTQSLEAQEQQTLSKIKKFIEESNDRISQSEAEIQKLQGLKKYKDMTMEDFRDAHPDIALDPINRPTIYPHTSEFQPGAPDLGPKDH